MNALLQGKKTYLVAGAAMLVIAGWALGFVPEHVAVQALTALGFGGLITLRAGISKAV